MSTPSASAVPSPRPGSQNLDRWARGLARGGAAVLVASVIAYAVAWAVAPSADTSVAAATISAVAAATLMSGVMTLALMSPLVTMLGVRALGVRSDDMRHPLVYAGLAAVVAVCLVAGVLATFGTAVDSLWSRWPQ